MRPVIFVVSVALAAAVALAGAKPASANITNVVFSASQTTNIVCPATITATATITGTPNQPLQAELLSTFNGSVKTLDGPVTATMPATGTLTGSATVSVPVLSGSGKLDYVVTQNGQFPVDKSITITCQPPPTPAPPGTYSGTVTSLTVSNKAVQQGEAVQFTANGTGKCWIQISGVPGAPPGAVGQMPFNIVVPMTKTGTFNALAIVLGLNGAPGNCNETSQISSYEQQVTVAPAPPNPPSIVSVTPQWSSLSTWRPGINYMYPGEALNLAIAGNQNNSATNAPNACMYQVTVKDLDNPSRGTIYSNTLAHFAPLTIPNLGPESLYEIDVNPPAYNNGFYLPECGGHATTNVRMLYPVGWITDIDLVGFGFHFNAGDNMTMPQFCDACTSIFSPAHNRSFLGVHPHTAGITAMNGNSVCVYQITAARGSDIRGGEAQYITGQPGAPRAFQAFTGPIGNPESPYWYMYNDDSDTVTVTISTAHDSSYPSCYIVNGTISRTITFTQNLSLPPVHVP